MTVATSALKDLRIDIIFGFLVFLWSSSLVFMYDDGVEEGGAVDDVEVLRQEEEEFDLISAEDHALEPYAENEMTVVDELGEGEEFEDGLADISIGTLVTAGAPLVVLACIFWGTGMVESSSSLFEALIRAPFQLALLGIGSQSRVAVAGYVLFMFYLAAQEISARTMYTFDGQFYVALGSLV
eukprot:CAMPEP_0113461538 /NCGR_PEP_ID=MMETSP0014_2-20120614/11598_1 /TAXON_ID=2857 /ORGANISM="Nitzschia sp." /LENGTH=182 /DNA_ID=CAMNT_0000353313 /DNA_START=626 /DNA_END=1171 /DNA_ORIENTATION=- /assembly_acc=CAM_ASM_000159